MRIRVVADGRQRTYEFRGRRLDAAATPRVAGVGPGLPDTERTLLGFDRSHHGSGFGLLFVDWVTQLSGGELAIDGNESG
ncbi:MAG: hypothetical protein V5A16_00810 [Haloplanus sp.]